MGAVTYISVILLAVVAFFLFQHGSMELLNINTHVQDGTAEKYSDLYSDQSSAGERKGSYEKVVNAYYDIATDFYEYGWGTSFHFAPRYPGESLFHSISRHEHYLALKLELGGDSNVLDVGCGVGGPAREIHRLTGSRVTGLNNNKYQVSRARGHTPKHESERVKFKHGDFMNIPFENGSFSSAYAIESTCHAPNRVGVFQEIGRVLDKGSLFGVYEWCLTPSYDPSNSTHNEIKKLIEEGNGLPDLIFCSDVLQAMKDAGFEIVEETDVVEFPRNRAGVPWYNPLQASWTLEGFRLTTVGRACTSAFVNVLEFLGLALWKTRKRMWFPKALNL